VRAALDLRVLDQPALAERGIGRYARELAAALPEDTIRLRALARPPAPARLAELWEHVLLGRDARRAGAELLHSPSIDFATTRPGIPYVVTLHDLVPLKQPERYLRTGVKHRLRYAAVKRATRVIVPSEAVAADARALLGIERVDVVPEAAGHAFRRLSAPRGLLARLRVPARFFVWVGGLDPPDPRKRITELAAHVARSPGLPLVLVGRYDARGAELAAEGRVVLTGRVSDQELAALYGAAEALLLPSEEEGFGLTAQEALACGTPVAACDSPALRETLAGRTGVRLVDPGDLAGLLAAGEELAEAEVDVPTRGWADVARETLAVYERAVSDTAGGGRARA